MWKWGGHVARVEQQRWAKAKSVRDIRTGKGRTGRQKTRWADTFKSAAGQWSRTTIKPVRIEYTHTKIENTRTIEHTTTIENTHIILTQQ
jgi:hypothetical protein